jgi:hypothetical protein
MRWCSAMLIAATAAGAHSITDEVMVNSTQSTSSNPRSGSLGDSLRANFDLAPRWGLSAGAMLTREGETPGTGNEFGTSSSTVGLLSLGADFIASDR